MIVEMYSIVDELLFFFLNVKGGPMAKDNRVPKDNVDFKLTIVRGGQTETRTFRLLNLGYCSDHAEAQRRADKRGFILAKVRWRMPFEKKFSKLTRFIDVVFGGSEWVRPSGHCDVPYLVGRGRAWYSGFDSSDGSFRGYCRWLASRKKSRKF
jgi:hypothetical protein